LNHLTADKKYIFGCSDLSYNNFTYQGPGKSACEDYLYEHGL